MEKLNHSPAPSVVTPSALLGFLKGKQFSILNLNIVQFAEHLSQFFQGECEH